MKTRLLSTTLVVFAISFLVGCSANLYSSLPESEANEIVAALSAAGIEAQKVNSGERIWSVEVDKNSVAEAVEVLRERGLPKDRFASLGDLFKRESIVSSPTEERMRYVHGVSQELSNTLSLLDGVITARVHVVIPLNDPLSTQPKPSSASVFIKHRADANLEPLSVAIRTVVMRAVEGLSEANISVGYFPAQPAPRPSEMRYVKLLGIFVAAKSTTVFWMIVVTPPLLLLLILIGILIWYKRELGNDFGRVKLLFSTSLAKLGLRRAPSD